MIIYVVEAMSSEAYEDTSWIVKVFDSEDKASAWVDKQIQEEDARDDSDTHCYIITEQVLE